jgi:hypothetical protein
MPRPDSPMCFKQPSEDSAALFKGNQQNFDLPTADEEGVPNVVFGIAELPVQGAWTETKGES